MGITLLFLAFLLPERIEITNDFNEKIVVIVDIASGCVCDLDEIALSLKVSEKSDVPMVVETYYTKFYIP